jgi:hypothetical protein
MLVVSRLSLQEMKKQARVTSESFSMSKVSVGYYNLYKAFLIGKITNSFCIYFFQICKYILTIFYQLTNKTRNLLHICNTIFTYLHNLR